MRRSALVLIMCMGLVSLFADVTYEGARSIVGPYLAILGASAAVVGFISGLGELIGYGLRYITGLISDRTGRYWFMTIAGYTINLVAVPMMALAGSWEIAAVLIIMERMGKAIRSPAKDAILSNATSQVGHGWGFGVHEAMDQIGALTGPLVVSIVLLYTGDYRAGFAALGISAVIAIVLISVTRLKYPDTAYLENERNGGNGQVSNLYRRYMIGVILFAAAYADFALISYHFQSQSIVSTAAIPLLYALAMGSDAISGLIFGRSFDRWGYPVMSLVVLISAFSPVLLFTGGLDMAMAGMVIWGIGLGAQESIMRAGIARMVPSGKRGRAFGMFNAVYGLSWFVGSTIIGVLYESNIMYVVAFCSLLQLMAIPVFLNLKDSNASTA